MTVEHLWSDADEAALGRCRAALEAGELAAALLAVEGATASVAAKVERRLDDFADEVRALRAESAERARRAPDEAPTAMRDVADGASSSATENPPRGLLGPSSPAIQAAVLRHVLVDRGQLRGDTESYYDPRNCMLSAVLDRGRGMPILLASVWMIVGARAGVPVCGVPLPGHFVARVGSGAGQIVDPFAAGRPLTPQHCAAIARQLSEGRGGQVADVFATARLDDLIARVLRNLQICHGRAQAQRPMYRAARMGALLFPARGPAQLAHARVAELIGLTPLAIALYAELIERFPATDEAGIAQTRLDALAIDAPSVH